MNRQKAVVKIINEDIKEMIKLCKEYKREMPTEIKMIFDVKANKLTADYNYELVHQMILMKLQVLLLGYGLNKLREIIFNLMTK